VKSLAIASVVMAMPLAGCAETWRSAPEPHTEDPVAAGPATAGARGSVFGYPWIWLDDHGERVSLARFRGTPLVITAVYTTCVEICPRTIAKLRTIYDELLRAGRRAEVIVVTLDPAVDTPARLRDYRRERRLPDAWHLLTGTREATEQLMAVLDVHTTDMDVHLVHDSRITLFDADGRRTAVLDTP
jgi:cytochrome oxidase Cu insertion factor (SCO1/SenC/PrrC family)